MNNHKKRHGRLHGISIELILAILIAICIVINTFVYHTYIDYTDNRYDNSIFVPKAYIGTENKELEELIREYCPDPTRMIEIYDTEFNLKSRVIIDADEVPDRDNNNLKDFPKLMKYFKDNSEGHTYYRNDKLTESDFYFTWYLTNDSAGEEQLVLIFMSRPRGIPGEIHDNISLIILGLTFGIIISIAYKENKRNKQLIKDYQDIDKVIEL